MYLMRLVKQLDLDRPDWREDSILLLDGAKVHVSDHTKAEINKLAVPIIFTAPYSYDGSPAEKWFSYLKNTGLAPLDIKTGKR